VTNTLRQFKTKDSSAQEAHEAIRPTDFNTTTAGEDSQQEKLYKLIWQRALSSQMSPAVTDKTEVAIDISSRPEVFTAKGEILVFDGFLRVYGGGKDDSLLPDLKEGQSLSSEGHGRNGHWPPEHLRANDFDHSGPRLR
jgi:DNA topoisomerase I